jgi:outer membrane protein assembly factor BamB
MGQYQVIGLSRCELLGGAMIMKVHKPLVPWVGVAVLLCSVGLCSAADWPQWRGPQRSGHTDEVDLPLTWDGKKQDNVLWKVAVDFGHSSPIVCGQRVFLSASVRKLPKGPDQKADNHQHRVVCYRTTDGAKLWQTDIEAGSWDTEFSFTAPTPVTDGQHLYAFFGSATVAALDVDGKLLWQRKLPGPFKAEWLSSSPILHQDTLFVFVDVSSDSWLLALDKKTGEVKWEVKRKQGDRAHNSSPLLLVVKDKPQIVVASQGAVLALDPRSTKEIWSCKWSGNRYPSLVAGSDLVYVTGEGGESLAIAPTGEGDVSKTHVKWRQAKTPQGFGTPVIVGDYLFRASPPGIVRCWKVSDGQLVFEERVEGIPTYPSPVATKDGRIYFASAGKSCVLKAGPKLEVLATNDLAEGERNEWTLTGPSAAVSEGKLFLRGPKSLTCIGKK